MKNDSFEAFLEQVLAQLGISIRYYSGTELKQEQLEAFKVFQVAAVKSGSMAITTEVRKESVVSLKRNINATFRVLGGHLKGVSLGLKFTFNNWSPQNYVLIPAAVYQGNRFQAVGKSYPFSIHDPEIVKAAGPGPAMLPVISPVPRLAHDGKVSSFQQLTGDCSTPGVGFYSPSLSQGFLLLTEQASALGNYGYVFAESADRLTATLQLLAPGVRVGENSKGDRGADLETNDRVELRCAVHVFPADSVQEFYDYFFSVRKELGGDYQPRHQLPFSAAWSIQEKKFNAQNWVEDHGYYSVGMREAEFQDWQTGWVGGLNTVLPMLAEGEEVTRRRALRTFDFLFPNGRFPSGFFRNACFRGRWLEPEAFLRHSADGITFLLKELMLLRQADSEIQLGWETGAAACADAFCTMWKRYGQIGQYADGETGDLRWGGTACAGIAIGGLALASEYFKNPAYLEVSEALANYFHANFVARGLTNGGPGDILQAPDSESAFGLLEGFMLLYEVSNEPRWLKAARDVAAQAASWVMTYDFEFPPESTFGRLNMRTTGTVFANVQNKHSAPGICTLSGDCLLKLFRATGEVRYLDLLVELAHAIPQFMSREDRPFGDVRPGQPWPEMPPGWINERVNTSDWEVNLDGWGLGVGEVFGGSTWAEVAMMLTWTELPGIYLQTDTGFLRVLDHVNARLISLSGDQPVCLEINNPTRFAATVKIFSETSAEAQTPLGVLGHTQWPRVTVPAGSSVRHGL